MESVPEKRYFTIGEVSTLCDLKPHVLRYWEQEFTALRPNKRRGNRRYYRREDVFLIQHIKHLLYEQGFTISGARAQLSTPGPALSVQTAEPIKREKRSAFSPEDRESIRGLLQEARDLLA